MTYKDIYWCIVYYTRYMCLYNAHTHVHASSASRRTSLLHTHSSFTPIVLSNMKNIQKFQRTQNVTRFAFNYLTIYLIDYNYLTIDLTFISTLSGTVLTSSPYSVESISVSFLKSGGFC